MLQSMGSQRVGQDLVTEQHKGNEKLTLANQCLLKVISFLHTLFHPWVTVWEGA